MCSAYLFFIYALGDDAQESVGVSQDTRRPPWKRKLLLPRHHSICLGGVEVAADQ